MLYTLQ